MKKINNLDRYYEYSESDQLGSGAFASVFKGKNCQNKSDVAVKVISRIRLKKYGEEIINAIGDEVNILQKLSIMQNQDPCPFIVKIFDCFQTTNNIYIILEYCNQGNLLDLIKTFPSGMPEQKAIPILYQIASAVNYIAKHEIVHRDIKPENIFIHEGVFKLGDFGFASQKNMFHTMLGTYPYMAPEFFKDPSYDKMVDVWAVGVLYHEMLFNELYFFGSSQYEVSQKICNYPYKIQRANLISTHSQDVLMKCIEKDKTKRITADLLISHPLFESVANDINIQKLIKAGGYSMQEQQILEGDAAKIVKILINTYNGLLFLMKIAEKLEFQFQNKFRFDIYYLIKKCLNGLSGLQASLIAKQPPNFIGNVKTEDWNAFVNSSQYNDHLSIVEQNKLIITNKFFEYATFMELFFKQNFPDQHVQMTQIVNKNPLQILQPQLFKEQLKNLFDQFYKQYAQSQSNHDLLIACMLAIAFNIDSCIAKQLINFEQFEQESLRYSNNEIIQLINLVVSS